MSAELSMARRGIPLREEASELRWMRVLGGVDVNCEEQKKYPYFFRTCEVKEGDHVRYSSLWGLW